MKKATPLLILGVAVFLVVACVTPARAPKTHISFPQTYLITDLIITVYGVTEQYPHAVMREQRPLGYTDGYSKHIHLLGERRKGDCRIVVPWEVLGHELLHIMETYNLDIADPDSPGGYSEKYGTVLRWKEISND
jgi:hypothetical protein